MRSRFIVLAAALAIGCGGTATKTAVPDERPPDGCTCDRIRGPLEIPSAELPRWKQADRAIAAMFVDLAAEFPDRLCRDALDSELRRVFDQHRLALVEDHALNVASCDHFSRWQHERRDADEAFALNVRVVVEGLQSCSERLSDPVNKALNELIIQRWCTVVQ